MQETYKGEIDESVYVFMSDLDPFLDALCAEVRHLLAVAQKPA